MWRLLPLLLLAACATAPTGPCQLQAVADLPATLDGNRLEVAGHVDGAETRFLIDTGAEATVLTTATVGALQLPRSQRSATQLTGIGGAVSNADVFAVLDLGTASFQRRLAVANIPALGGIIGGDILSDYDLELDLPGHRVRLWHARGCHAADLPWTGPRATVPMEVTGGERLRVPVTIDGQPVEALLDSGAGRTLLQLDTAERLGLTAANGASDPVSFARGVDGGVVQVHAHRFGTLTVGEDRLNAPWIGVAAFQMTGGQMLLGVDYLRTRRVWVSYRTGQLYVQVATPGT